MDSEKAKIKFLEMRTLKLHQGQMMQMRCDISLHMIQMLLSFFFSNPPISSDLVSIIYSKYLGHVMMKHTHETLVQSISMMFEILFEPEMVVI